MKDIMFYAVYVYVGVIPFLFGDFGIAKWQTWVFIIATNIFIGIHDKAQQMN